MWIAADKRSNSLIAAHRILAGYLAASLRQCVDIDWVGVPAKKSPKE